MQASSNCSEQLESEDELPDSELRKSICSSIYAALCAGESLQTPLMGRRPAPPATAPHDRLNFSPAESLESSVSDRSLGSDFEIDYFWFHSEIFSCAETL